jgi:hypothetical protein
MVSQIYGCGEMLCNFRKAARKEVVIMGITVFLQKMQVSGVSVYIEQWQLELSSKKKAVSIRDKAMIGEVTRE